VQPVAAQYRFLHIPSKRCIKRIGRLFGISEYLRCYETGILRRLLRREIGDVLKSVYLVRRRSRRQSPGIVLLSARPGDGKSLLHLFEGICRNPQRRIIQDCFLTPTPWSPDPLAGQTYRPCQFFDPLTDRASRHPSCPRDRCRAAPAEHNRFSRRDEAARALVHDGGQEIKAAFDGPIVIHVSEYTALALGTFILSRVLSVLDHS